MNKTLNLVEILIIVVICSILAFSIGKNHRVVYYPTVINSRCM